MTASPVESVAALRAAADAAAAVARFDVSVQRSSVRDAAFDVFELLDAAGAQALENEPLDVAHQLTLPERRRDATLQRLVRVRRRYREEGPPPLDLGWLQGLGGAENAGRVEPRAHGLGRRERETLTEGERVPRGQDKLIGELRDWLDWIERGGRDVHPLVLVACAHRRWLALRPFVAGNVRLAHVLDDALLRGEGQFTTVKPPMARWLARSVQSYRQRLAAGYDDEASWVVWWLTSLARCADDAVERLTAWEALAVALRERDPGFAREVGEAFMTLACAPAFDRPALLERALTSRAAAGRWLERSIEDGVFMTVEGTRGTRLAHVEAIAALVDADAFALSETCL